MKLPLLLLASSVLLCSAWGADDRGYDVQHYSLQMVLDPRVETPDLKAQTQIRLRNSRRLESLELDSEDLKVEEVRISAPWRKTLEFSQTDGKLTLSLPKALPPQQTVVLEIRHTVPVQNRQLGLFRVKDLDDPGRGWLYFTQFEPTGARKMFPCNDSPADKATTELKITLPEGYTAISNGRKALERKVRQNGEALREFLWRMDQPHSTYLISLAAGKFESIQRKLSGKPVSFWVGAQNIKASEYALTSTGETLKFFEEYLGTEYPWPKYATIALPTFIWGGMENTSATTMNQERILLVDPSSVTLRRRIYGLVAHEAAHQWFGDLVTMRGWEDLWLNEAFASHLESRATAAKFGEVESSLATMLDVWEEYFRQENGPRSRPLVDVKLTSPEDAFDAVAYTKGEAVLKMLAHEMGEASFRKGLKLYLQAFRFKNANYRDFFDIMQKATKRPLNKFRDSWLLQRGYPVVRYQSRWDASKKQLSLQIDQKSNHAEDRSIFHFRLPVVFHRRTQPEYHRPLMVEIAEGQSVVALDLPAEPEWISVNVGSPVLADFRFEGKDLTPVLLQAANDPDPHSRVWAFNQLLAPLREGRDLSRPAADALANALGADPSPYTRSALIHLLEKLPVRWLPKDLGTTALTLARQAGAANFASSPLAQTDRDGWAQWRSRSFGLLAKVQDPQALPFLLKLLDDRKLALDDLDQVVQAVAAIGAPESVAGLQKALQVHGARGYRYRFDVQLAFGALERPEAASQIRELAKTARPDLLGRIGWRIRDNTVLRGSSEWADALKELVLENEQVDVDVKMRLMGSVEEVKTRPVRSLLENIVSKNPNPRLTEYARKMLTKNF